LFWPPLRNDRAIWTQALPASFQYSFFFGNRARNRDQVFRGILDAAADSYNFNTGTSVQSNDYRSLASTESPGNVD
jgi:hypothetical protein